MSQQVWYVAFGSNTVPAMLGRYVPVEDVEHRAVTIPHELYFAGKAWGAAPAFVEHVRNDEVATPARAYLLDVAHLPRLMGGENGQFADEWRVDIGVMKSSDVIDYPVPLDSDEGVGKYNALLRLDDIDGLPAVTITTTHQLTRGGPSDEYLTVIRAGLSADHDIALLEQHLQAAIERSHPTNGLGTMTRSEL